MKKTRPYYFSDGQLLYELLERKLNSTFKLLTLIVKSMFNVDKLLNVNGGRIQLIQGKGLPVRENF